LESILWLQIITYILFAVIVIVFATRLARYAKMPTHLRWELYPLAGEKNRPWGGSYLEESEWWTKPQEEKSLLGEIRFIVVEILLFKEYFRLNRNYWYLVYPFHIGVFLFVGFLILLIVGALTMVAGVAVSAESVNTWGSIIYYLTLITGGAGLILGIIGSIGVLARRMIDGNLKPYTEYVKSLITFSPASGIEPVAAIHIILLLLIAAYMPFTNMMHFFAKTFTYHNVRWDDAPNMRGNKLERRLVPLLSQPLSWSAPHMQTIHRWSDIAHETAIEGAKEEPTPRIRKGESS